MKKAVVVGTPPQNANNGYFALQRVRGRLNELNERAQVLDVTSSWTLDFPRRNPKNSFRSDKQSHADDNLVDVCLSTSVIPSILLYDKLTKGTAATSSEYTLPEPPRFRSKFVEKPTFVCDNFDQPEKDAQVAIEAFNKSQVQDEVASSEFAGSSDKMSFLDEQDLEDENLVDELLREVEDIDSVGRCEPVDKLDECLCGEVESESGGIKRQWSLIGEKQCLMVCVSQASTS